jgi:hypothetical protein
VQAYTISQKKTSDRKTYETFLNPISDLPHINTIYGENVMRVRKMEVGGRNDALTKK